MSEKLIAQIDDDTERAEIFELDLLEQGYKIPEDLKAVSEEEALRVIQYFKSRHVLACLLDGNLVAKEIDNKLGYGLMAEIRKTSPETLIVSVATDSLIGADYSIPLSGYMDKKVAFFEWLASKTQG